MTSLTLFALFTDKENSVRTAFYKNMSRFGNINADDFTKEQKSKRTEQATKYSVRIFKDFCLEKCIDASDNELSTMEVPALVKTLSDFYANIRNKDGDIYSKNTLCAIRQGIRRYLQEPPVSRDFDIITDPRFKSPNVVFNSMLKKTRQEGKGTVKHKKPIPVGDLKKLYEHPRALNPDIPKGLLNKVLFEVLLYFCRRGRENLRELKVDDFAVKTDENGRRYVIKTTTEQTKNHTGITNELEGDGARMYETDTKMCPVKSFEKYLSKRNTKCESLFQYPRNSYLDSNESWYENRPLGKNSIGEFMSKLSETAQLSDVFTNHCIRATTITMLNDCGFKDRDIISVSGHRNEKSLASYVSDTRPTTKRAMSDALSCATNISIQSGKSNPVPRATVPVKNALPSLDISEIDFMELESDSDNLLAALNLVESEISSVPNEQSRSSLTFTEIQQGVPRFNISNCVVNINYNR